MRVVVIADMFEALSADRPYRETMPREKVLDILRKDAGTAIVPKRSRRCLPFSINTALHLSSSGPAPSNPRGTLSPSDDHTRPVPGSGDS